MSEGERLPRASRNPADRQGATPEHSQAARPASGTPLGRGTPCSPDPALGHLTCWALGRCSTASPPGSGAPLLGVCAVPAPSAHRGTAGLGARASGLRAERAASRLNAGHLSGPPDHWPAAPPTTPPSTLPGAAAREISRSPRKPRPAALGAPRSVATVPPAWARDTLCRGDGLAPFLLLPALPLQGAEPNRTEAGPRCQSGDRP